MSTSAGSWLGLTSVSDARPSAPEAFPHQRQGGCNQMRARRCRLRPRNVGAVRRLWVTSEAPGPSMLCPTTGDDLRRGASRHGTTSSPPPLIPRHARRCRRPCCGAHRRRSRDRRCRYRLVVELIDHARAPVRSAWRSPSALASPLAAPTPHRNVGRSDDGGGRRLPAPAACRMASVVLRHRPLAEWVSVVLRHRPPRVDEPCQSTARAASFGRLVSLTKKSTTRRTGPSGLTA